MTMPPDAGPPAPGRDTLRFPPPPGRGRAATGRADDWVYTRARLLSIAIAKNKVDDIFNPLLLMDVVKTPEGEKATFNFVVEE